MPCSLGSGACTDPHSKIDRLWVQMKKAAYRAPALPDGVVAGMLDVIEARRRSLAAI